MNIFSSVDFLNAVATAHFPGETPALREIVVRDRHFRLLFCNGKPVRWLPFLDFYEEVPPLDRDARRLRWLPAVAHGFVERDSWLQAPTPNHRPSPRVEWARFATWESYLEAIRERPGIGFGKSAADRRKKLEKTVGPLRFVWHDKNPHLLTQCMAWKSQQYGSGGHIDQFARQGTVRLFHALLERDLLRLSCLFAGDRPLAIHAGLEWEGRFYYWVPAYDGALHAQSPGTILLLELLEATYKRSLKEFDFLVGNESYKWKFATDARLIAPIGVRLWQDLAWTPLRRALVRGVRKFPKAEATLREARRWVTGR